MADKILVSNCSSYASAIKGLGVMAYDAKDFMQHPKDYKLVLFTGGADVSPYLYNDASPKGICCCSSDRDRTELLIAEHALEHGILMCGICRGSQFLNVFAGGRMMHHVNGHAGGRLHGMAANIFDNPINVNTLHHQMIILPEDGLLVGWADKSRSDIYIGRNDEVEDWQAVETEAIILPRTKSFGVQYHPEMMWDNTAGYGFFWHMVKNALKIPDFNEFAESYMEKRGDLVYLDQKCTGQTAGLKVA